MVQKAIDRELRIVIPAGVVGQVWRDGSRQARIASLLANEGVSVEPLDDRCARAAGHLCGARGTADVIDASVVLGARARGDHIVTSAPEDLARLDPRVPLIVV
jgi:hypothetical protein